MICTVSPNDGFVYVWNGGGIAMCPRPLDRAEVLPDDEEHDDELFDDGLED